MNGQSKELNAAQKVDKLLESIAAAGGEWPRSSLDQTNDDALYWLLKSVYSVQGQMGRINENFRKILADDFNINIKGQGNTYPFKTEVREAMWQSKSIEGTAAVKSQQGAWSKG